MLFGKLIMSNRAAKGRIAIAALANAIRGTVDGQIRGMASWAETSIRTAPNATRERTRRRPQFGHIAELTIPLYDNLESWL